MSTMRRHVHNKATQNPCTAVREIEAYHTQLAKLSFSTESSDLNTSMIRVFLFFFVNNTTGDMCMEATAVSKTLRLYIARSLPHIRKISLCFGSLSCLPAHGTPTARPLAPEG